METNREDVNVVTASKIMEQIVSRHLNKNIKFHFKPKDNFNDKHGPDNGGTKLRLHKGEQKIGDHIEVTYVKDGKVWKIK